MFELVIIGDENDADYITAINAVSAHIIENVIRPVVEAIKGSALQYNWDISEYGDDNARPHIQYVGFLTNEQIDAFNEYIPYSECGIHSITSVEYYQLPNKIKLL